MRAIRRSATIRDVAEAAGVSPATVSHAFSGRRRIAASTRQRVLAAARELAYVPNPHARKLRLGTSGMIGLALRPRAVRALGPDAAETFNRLAGSTATEALRRGLGLVHVPDLDDDGANLVPMDGCIVAHPVRGDRTAALLEASGTPVVLIDEDPARPGDPWSVGADYGRGIRETLAEASADGLREVLLLPGAEPNAWNLTARAEHAAHCARHGHPQRVAELEGGLTGDALRAAVDAGLSLLRPPAAVVFAASDLTPTILSAVRERSWSVPEQVALAALTDTVHSRAADPPVTALDLVHEQVAAAAVELLLARIAGATAPPAPLRIPPVLTARSSTRV